MLLADGEEGINQGRLLRRGMAPGEEVVLAPQCNRSDRIFDRVVVDVQVSVIQVCVQGVPPCIGIGHRLANLAPGKRALYLPKEPFAHLVDYRQGLRKPQFLDLRGERPSCLDRRSTT